MSQTLDRSKEEVVQVQVRFNELCRYPERSVREMRYFIRQSWRGCTCKKIQAGSAATGSGGLGTDVTTPSGAVEPNSFVAAGDLLSSFSTARPEDPKKHQKVPMFLWRTQNKW